MAIQPYLFFHGRCEEAIEFYKQALGAKVTALLRFNDSPDSAPPGTVPPGLENKVMHSALQIGDSVVLASDGMSVEPVTYSGIELALTASGGGEAARWFEALSDGGKVTVPLGKTFFSPSFGAVTDRFGVPWMIVVPME